MTPFEEFYLYLTQISSIIPVVAGFWYYKKLTLPFKILFYFCVLSALFEPASRILMKVYLNNIPGQQLYTVLEFLTLSLVFYLSTLKRNLRLLIVINALVFIVLAARDAIHSIWELNELSHGYAAVSMMLYALGYLYHLFTVDDTRYMREYPMFWLCISMLVYFALNALYFIGETNLINENSRFAWGFHLSHGALIIIANCLLANAFRCLGKQKAIA